VLSKLAHLTLCRSIRLLVLLQSQRPLVTQQARNLLLVLSERGQQVRSLLHDRDDKSSHSFDELFGSEGAKVLLTPVRAPRATRTRSAGSAQSAPSAWTGC
jgi:hypothetical protein